MKTVIVIIATVILGVILYFFILGDSNSLKTEATRIFNSGINQLETIP
jgi:hypothetical protein